MGIKAWVCVRPPLFCKVVSSTESIETDNTSLPLKPVLPVVSPIKLELLLLKPPKTSGVKLLWLPAIIELLTPTFTS